MYQDALESKALNTINTSLQNSKPHILKLLTSCTEEFFLLLFPKHGRLILGYEWVVLALGS